LQKAINRVPLLPEKPGDPYRFGWTPRQDGELFKQKELQELSKKPTIIGVDSLEDPIPDVNQIPVAQQLLSYTLDTLFPGNDRRARTLKDLIRFVYLDLKGDRDDPTFVVQQSGKILANLGFHAVATYEAGLKSAAGFPVWVYNFDYYCKNEFPTDFPFEKGAPHAYELQFQFDAAYEGCDQTEFNRVADYLNEMWTNFAKNGDPSPTGVVWPRFKTAYDANMMHIQLNLNVEANFYADVERFWFSLVPSV